MLYRFITRVLIPIFSLIVATILHHFLFVAGKFNNTMEILQIGIIVVVFIFIQQLLFNLLERYIKVIFSTKLLDTETKKMSKARDGLIVFLSLYTLTPEGKTKWKEKYGYHPDDDKKKFKDDVKLMNSNKDYKGLLIDDLFSTNLGPTTRAILTHLTRLKSLWIIPTQSRKDPTIGSNSFISTYELYLREQLFMNKKISLDYTYMISIDEDSNVAEETSDTLSLIYRNAKLKPSKIIVDVTSGTSSMTVGAVLGSIGRERDIQLLAAGYEAGRGLVRMNDPVIIQYQTILPRESE